VLFPIKQLIKETDSLVCVQKTALVREALTLMIKNDFSQLPVVNEQGNLIGLISESSIINTYFHVGTALSLLDLTVDHCMAKPKTISPDSDILEALNLLENVYAIVVVEGQKPIGILTDYDTTKFFRDLSEGLIIVEDIEVTLRQFIEAVIPDSHSMDAALMRAFKENKKDPARPAKEYEDLSFGDHIQLIIEEHNWSKFIDYFSPKELFTNLMQQVGEIRNQLAHFRGRLDPMQLNTLLRSRDWLSSRSKPGALLEEIAGLSEIKLGDLIERASDEFRFDELMHWLAGHPNGGQSRVRLAFSQIEELIGHKLPESARKYRSWWTNDPATHPHALSWVYAGWLIDDVDLDTEEVSLRQTNVALYYAFFTDLLTRIKSIRPGITQVQKASMQNWLSLSSGTSGFSFAWVLPREPIFRVELYIDKGDYSDNKVTFQGLMNQKIEIETEIGENLSWTPLEEARASRIFASIPFHITFSQEEHERAKQWGVEMMLKFMDVFRPRLRGL
jgi:CBS domain-containing protein